MFPKYKSKQLPSRKVDDQLHVSFGILKTTSVISLVAHRILNQTGFGMEICHINCRNCLPQQLPTLNPQELLVDLGMAEPAFGWMS